MSVPKNIVNVEGFHKALALVLKPQGPGIRRPQAIAGLMELIDKWAEARVKEAHQELKEASK